MLTGVVSRPEIANVRGSPRLKRYLSLSIHNYMGAVQVVPFVALGIL